ncbi:MAG: MFS transporter [Planctomycetaceae bacterium]
MAELPHLASDSGQPDDLSKPWYASLTRYHWFVLLVAALGWLFDCLDQQLFILARAPAMNELIPAEGGVVTEAVEQARRAWGDYATSIFIAGWATGGLIFGILGDRIGRAKTMMITILLYSAFTGLSALSQSPIDFAIYRLLTGLGVGGEFAVGVALVAEVMPTNRSRSYALAMLQALSAFGNLSAAFINYGLGIAEETGLPYSPWRIMFMIGAVPALLALVVRWKLKEPEKWQQARHDDAVEKRLGSYRELFRDPKLRKHALLGLALGCSGIIGLWSVGFFTMDLIQFVQRKPVSVEVYQAELAAATTAGDAVRAASVKELLSLVDGTATSLSTEAQGVQTELDGKIKGQLKKWASFASIAINIGAFFGMFGFGALAQRIGRKPTFAMAFLAAFVTTASVFWFLQDMWQIWVMVPLMGFCQLSLFAGYAIYFPELFPTHLRSTGTSFCYNVGRFVAALGPIIKAQLEMFFKDTPEPLRYAGVTMCVVFLLGLVVLPFLPETLDQGLPE